MTPGLKKIVVLSSVALLLITIVGYTYFRTRDLITGTRLSVVGIRNYETYKNSLLKLSGTAKHSTRLTLNGREIPVNKDWAWKESLLLAPGWNIIEIKSEDKFGRKEIISYKVIKL